MLRTRIYFVLLALGIGLALQTAPNGFYDSNPANVWNRLHETLFVREYRGTPSGYDELYPLLWSDSHYLIVRPRHQQVLSILDEALRSGSPVITDSLKRAILQHDLWAIFDWAVNGQKSPTERDSLARALARVIRRLALPGNEIRSLPDNYAQAVSSREFAEQYASDRSRQPFLPPDLFRPDGGWVELSAFGGRLVARS